MPLNLALEFNPVPKSQQLSNKRTSPKRGNSGKFSHKTIQRIGERDGWLCVRCTSPYIETVPHHIIFKSQLGKGTEDNGATVCRPCHDWAHGKRKGPDGEPAAAGRKWFEQFRLKLLEVTK